MTDRFVSPAAPRRTSMLVNFALILMTVGVVFLSGIVVYALIKGDPQADLISANVERLLKDQTDARNANACTGYQNHRALENDLLDIARLNGIKSGDPRVLPSDETIRACRAVGIEIDEQGVPEISDVTTQD